jgi:hypothetical protein
VRVLASIAHALTSTIPEGQVWKSPDVTETDGVSNAGENEFDLTTPSSTLHCSITAGRRTCFHSSYRRTAAANAHLAAILVRAALHRTTRVLNQGLVSQKFCVS